MNCSILTKEVQSGVDAKAVSDAETRFKCYFCEGNHKFEACDHRAQIFKKTGVKFFFIFL